MAVPFPIAFHMIGGFAIPVLRLTEIFLYTIPIVIAIGQFVLRIGMSLLSGFAIPMDGITIYLEQRTDNPADPFLIFFCQFILPFDISLFSCLTVPIQGHVSVFLH